MLHSPCRRSWPSSDLLEDSGYQGDVCFWVPRLYLAIEPCGEIDEFGIAFDSVTSPAFQPSSSSTSFRSRALNRIRTPSTRWLPSQTPQSSPMQTERPGARRPRPGNRSQTIERRVLLAKPVGPLMARVWVTRTDPSCIFNGFLGGEADPH
jgi:hypothetical protein